ncbi:MAG: ribonuclease HII [Rhodothermales bacterium]
MAKRTLKTAPLDLEHIHWRAGKPHVAGVDEVGRGCLAGPVVAAAVVLPWNHSIEGVRDSKAISEKRRLELVQRIQTEAIATGIGMCSPEEIDELNILWASMEAMRRAILHLSVTPDVVLVDGNRAIPDAPWPQETVVKGDAKSQSIAAASILAKTVRDGLMADLDGLHPAFGWARNVGYPTAEHYAALAIHGPTVYHRRSFKLKR